MRRFPFFASLLVTSLLVLASGVEALAQTPVGSPATGSSSHGIQIADMQPSMPPGADFYQYANGGWLASDPLPAGADSYGAIDELVDLVEQQQFDQIDALIQSGSAQSGSDLWKAIEFYKQGVDMDARNADGLAPVQPQLDVIASITDLMQMHQLMASPAFAGIPDFFNAYGSPDYADSSVQALWLAGPPLGLRDSTVYTVDDSDNYDLRAAYKTMAAALFQRTGMTEAESVAAAQAVYDLEATMAANMLAPAQGMEPDSVYNPTALDDMETLYPALDWQAYMTALGATVTGSTNIVDTQVQLMQNLGNILAATDIRTVKHYLTLQLLLQAAPYLGQDVLDIHVAFEQLRTGATEPNEVEEDVLETVNDQMTDALGQLYASQYVTSQTRADAETMASNLIAAFRVRLQNNTWMSADTKAAALDKIDALRVQVGYPDAWRSYASYPLGDSYYATGNGALIAETTEQMRLVGQPIDERLWNIGAQEVNAIYDRLQNDVTFPAAYLQPPFYDPQADLASNYGGIGYSIGHEITHAVDPLNARFDAQGNFGAGGWTDADIGAVGPLLGALVAQYSQIEVAPGVFVDGVQTLGENIADMGGIQTAYDALTQELQQSGDPGPIDGLTQAQRFFIATAQIWQETATQEYFENQVASDFHAPALARATVPARNMDAFAQAFGIVAGDEEFIAPADRVVIW